MSYTYPEHPNTNFPDDTDVLFYMSDPQTDDLNLINQFYALKTMEEKNAFLNQNPQLNNKLFNANKFNKIADSILAMQKFYRDRGFAGSGFKMRGIWNNYINYSIGDCVSYKNIIWQAAEDNINSEPSDNNTNWLQVLTSVISTGLTWGELAGK